MMSKIEVKVLSTEGCGNTPPTVALVEATAAELGLSIHLSQLVVATSEEASLHNFHGSPSVQINGLDIDPTMRDSLACGFT
jgi:hypothetical protein